MRKMPGKRVPRMERVAERKMRNHPRQARSEHRRRPEKIALMCFFSSYFSLCNTANNYNIKLNRTSQLWGQSTRENLPKTCILSPDGVEMNIKKKLEKRDLDELRVFGRWVRLGDFPQILQNWDKIQPRIVLQGLSSATFWKDRRCFLIRLNTEQRQTLWREEPKRAMPRQVRGWNIQS